MNAWAFAVVLALAVASTYAGHLGLGPIGAGVISTRVIHAPTLVAAPAPLLHSGLVAAPLSLGHVGTIGHIGSIGHIGAAPLAAGSIW